MAALHTLLEIPGVVAAWRWQPGSISGTLRGPRLVDTCGNITTEMAELAMRYLEMLGVSMFFQLSILDHRLKREAFVPAQSIMVEAKDFTGVASVNRVGVLLDNAKRPNFWELERQMLEIENTY